MTKYLMLFLLAFHLSTAAAQSVAPLATQVPTKEVNGSTLPMELAVLRAQLETTKQFQDSFMSMAQWTLGSAIAIALALGAFAWHTNKSNYERDRESIQREAHAMAIEVRAEMLAQFQAESQKLEDSLGVREQALKQAVEDSINPKLQSFDSRVKSVETETLKLKDEALERSAEESLKEGRYRTAVRRYCELLELQVRRGIDHYFAAEILDKLREIAKNSAATLDADSVTLAVNTLTELPKAHHAACEPLIELFKRKLA